MNIYIIKNEVERLNGSTGEQMIKFSEWVSENLGEKTGAWYSPYLEKMGILLKQFGLDKNLEFHDNFFDYQTYEEFKKVYQQIIGQSDHEIEEILKGRQLRYPDSFAEQKLQWNREYAQMTYERGERSKPNQYGGIAGLGVILRAYLKFIYYDENLSLVYPKKEKKTSTHNGEVDDSINYWVYSPSNDVKIWEGLYDSGVIGLGWDFLGDLKQYNSRSEIEKVMSEHMSNKKRPVHDSKAVWDFYREAKPGDVVYVGIESKRIIGRGEITGEYYFDNSVSEYKHRHNINWTNKGAWDLEKTVAIKTLTNINHSPDMIVYIEQLISGNKVEQDTLLINEFKIWLSQQVQQNGEYLSDKTIIQKISSLKDIQNTFNVSIFGETDTLALKNIKEVVLADKDYDRYKGVSSSSIDYYIRYVESIPVIEENESYFLEEFLSEVFIDKEDLDRLQSVLQNKKNLILKGAPGVGKTFIADRLAYLMMEERDESRIQIIQFHQSYSYEDFIEGYRPKAEGEGFELKQGPFVKFSRKAERDPERDYFFIIDEINRGNMSKIFGELMMLIETDKRGKNVNLLYSNEKFSVPANLYIIGMMNTADRSLALLDYALRRRFSFFDINPAFENQTFMDYLDKMGRPKKMLEVINVVKELNPRIIDELGSGFQIGHSYFVDEAFEVNPDVRIKEVVDFEIIPQLYEYWFDDEEKAEEWANKLRGAYNGA